MEKQDYEKVAELQENSGDNDDSTAKIDVKSRIKKAKVALKRAGKKDLYAILGVSQGADEAEIKKAYKKAALKYVPFFLPSKGLSCLASIRCCHYTP